MGGGAPLVAVGREAAAEHEAKVAAICKAELFDLILHLGLNNRRSTDCKINDILNNELIFK